jgi:hypothetical protein
LIIIAFHDGHKSDLLGGKKQYYFSKGIWNIFLKSVDLIQIVCAE